MAHGTEKEDATNEMSNNSGVIEHLETSGTGAVDAKDPHAAVAHAVIEKYVVMGAAVNFIPVPILDSAAVAAVQVAMLRELSKLYGVDFRADLGKSLIAALIGTAASSAATSGALGALQTVFSGIPLLSVATKIVSIPLVSGGVTYAVGKTFQNHFATGGNLMNFEVAKAKDYMKTKYRSFRGTKAAEPAAA